MFSPCSPSANVLNIKPCIEVDNTTGKMKVGKKYRGSLDKVLKHYTLDKLKDRTDLKLDRVFITHSGISEERIEIVRKTIEEVADFGNSQEQAPLYPLTVVLTL